MGFKEGNTASPKHPSKRAVVVPMSPDDRQRYEAAKNVRNFGSFGNTSGNTWGFGSAPDAWAGTARSPLDVLYPKKDNDPEKNPWGY